MVRLPRHRAHAEENNEEAGLESTACIDYVHDWRGTLTAEAKGFKNSNRDGGRGGGGRRGVLFFAARAVMKEGDTFNR